jgi:hypothetical protein
MQDSVASMPKNGRCAQTVDTRTVRLKAGRQGAFPARGSWRGFFPISGSAQLTTTPQGTE